MTRYRMAKNEVNGKVLLELNDRLLEDMMRKGEYIIWKDVKNLMRIIQRYIITRHRCPSDSCRLKNGESLEKRGVRCH